MWVIKESCTQHMISLHVEISDSSNQGVFRDAAARSAVRARQQGERPAAGQSTLRSGCCGQVRAMKTQLFQVMLLVQGRARSDRSMHNRFAAAGNRRSTHFAPVL